MHLGSMENIVFGNQGVVLRGLPYSLSGPLSIGISVYLMSAQRRPLLADVDSELVHFNTCPRQSYRVIWLHG